MSLISLAILSVVYLSSLFEISSVIIQVLYCGVIHFWKRDVAFFFFHITCVSPLELTSEAMFFVGDFVLMSFQLEFLQCLGKTR
jgi:hypothetical protein